MTPKAFPKPLAYLWIVLALGAALGSYTNHLPPVVAMAISTVTALLGALTHSIPQTFKLPAWLGWIGIVGAGLSTVAASLATSPTPMVSASVATVVATVATILTSFSRNVQGAIPPDPDSDPPPTA